MTVENEFIEAEQDTQSGKYLTFLLADETYGLSIRHVIEIIGLQQITKIPDAPAYVKGIVNLRGKVIPIIDVRIRFNLPQRDYDARTCIVVIKVRDAFVGLVVDTVSEVLDIAEEDIEPPPTLGGGDRARFMEGIGKTGSHVQLLLDAECLLFVDAGQDASPRALGAA